MLCMNKYTPAPPPVHTLSVSLLMQEPLTLVVWYSNSDSVWNINEITITLQVTSLVCVMGTADGSGCVSATMLVCGLLISLHTQRNIFFRYHICVQASNIRRWKVKCAHLKRERERGVLNLSITKGERKMTPLPSPLSEDRWSTYKSCFICWMSESKV